MTRGTAGGRRLADPPTRDPAAKRTARTLDDVAALSGVSRATVSRVINGGPASAAAQRRVRAVLADVDFRPNAAAGRSSRDARRGRRGPARRAPPALQRPLLRRGAAGIGDYLAGQGTGMMLSLGSRTKQETLAHVLWMSFLDEVIVSASTLETPLSMGCSPRRCRPCCSASPHRRDRELRRHRQRGGRRWRHDAPALLTRSASVTSQAPRHRGRRGPFDRLPQALGRVGLSTKEFIVDGNFDQASGTTGASRLLDRGVDALFCGNDAHGGRCVGGDPRRRLQVPEDVALAGFDDLDFAAQLDPPLTTVRQGVRRQGSEAARALLGLLESPAAGPRRVILPTELIIRQSTVGSAPHG